MADAVVNQTEKMDVDDAAETKDQSNEKADSLNDSKESEENVDAIKKFIEAQDTEIVEGLEKTNSSSQEIENVLESLSDKTSDEPVKADIADTKDTKTDLIPIPNDNAINNDAVETDEDNSGKEIEESIAVASDVLDKLLRESVNVVDKKKDEKYLVKTNAEDKGNSIQTLSIGSKVEAKDFGEYWHPAEIVEVDHDEMEVLVHYEHANKKHDEWISVSSPRLRPQSRSSYKLTSKPATPTLDDTNEDEHSSSEPVLVKEEKPEEKPKLTFCVGERVYARWRDNRRFIATIDEVLGDGQYKIIFDDGAVWTCATARLYKVKESLNTSSNAEATVQTCGAPISLPVDGQSSNAALLPMFNTHLFDPTRDYLSSKSERRAMKRKLNIKEIFNIGQKKKKVETPKPAPKIAAPKANAIKVNASKAATTKAKGAIQKAVIQKEVKVSVEKMVTKTSTPKETTPKVKTEKEKTPKVVKKKLKLEQREVKVKNEVTKVIPEAVASIIGTVDSEPPKKELKDEIKDEIKDELKQEDELVVEEINLDARLDADDVDLADSETLSAPESQEMTHLGDGDQEARFENFEETDRKPEEMIGRLIEVIDKLEDGLNNDSQNLLSPKLEVAREPIATPEKTDEKPIKEEKPKKSKMKKGKKLRMLQEKKVKKQVEKVKSELEEMKRQFTEMKKQMLVKTEELAVKSSMNESFLLPGEWCCRWVNGQPVGTVSEMETEKVDAFNRPALPRRSVQVEDKRMPEGWTRHMVRRSLGSSAGKWDVVLVSPDGKRFHTKTDMRQYLEHHPDLAVSLKPYEHALIDFGVHLKLARRMGWYTTTSDGQQASPVALPVGTLSTTSPLVKQRKLSLKKAVKMKKKKLRRGYAYEPYPSMEAGGSGVDAIPGDPTVLEASNDYPPLEDGFVYVGSLKVQILENLLRCPAEGCFKNFRNNTLLKMHIKHYHRELTKMLGDTPKVLDLASARTKPTEMEMRRLKLEAQHKTFKVKLPKLPKRMSELKTEPSNSTEIKQENPLLMNFEEKIPRSQDSPKLRQVLSNANRPVKRPKVLLPVRRAEEQELQDNMATYDEMKIKTETCKLEQLDFETAISTHTVTKPIDVRRKGDKKRKSFASIAKKTSEDEDWYGTNELMNSDVETRSSCPRSGSPDSKIDHKLNSESTDDKEQNTTYMYNETGERIKLVRMKREEIINCHCGFREEDGLMVQCELCLCWQHAMCHNIHSESEVADKYTCSICLNPRRGRRSQRFLHDQDRLYEGLLPGAKPCESLRRSHELSGNLLRIEDSLHALKVKYFVATKKDHPKLYLWAKDWEAGELTMTQEKLNSDYSDLNIMISSIGKENLPLKPDDMKDMGMDIKTPPSGDPDEERFSQGCQLSSVCLLSGLLSSPSLDLPCSTIELERLANTVQAEQESQRVIVPQPEAAIENSACRERLLRHIQRCQALIDARLDSIEAQVAELESQDPSFEDDETADFFPRTKQTVQMLMRDLDSMEELGVIT